jgi:hypothetical protein
VPTAVPAGGAAAAGVAGVASIASLSGDDGGSGGSAGVPSLGVLMLAAGLFGAAGWAVAVLRSRRAR